MAADRSRLAAALAYEEERRRRMMESVPGLVTTPAQPAPRTDFRTNLENLSIGLGEGLTNQLEGIKGVITDPVGTAKGVYEAGRAVIRDPSVIADALRYTAQKATSGPLGAGEVIGEMIGPMRGKTPMAELDVYHGTPHRFPATEANPLGEFDASKIGTGEGAQAYGHGIYYAENPNVAKGYQSTLRETNAWEIDGQRVHGVRSRSDAQPINYAANALERFDGDKKAAIAWLKDSESPWDLEAAQLLAKSKTAQKAPGSLYKADLPDEMIDRMLDWDKPLSEQRELATPILKELGYLRPNDDGPRQFSQAVKALALEHGGFGESGATGMALFNAIYKGLQQGKPKAINLAKRMNLNEQEMFMEASPLASEVMKRMGIPGIKYLDAGSRGQGGTGTRNFVVFPGEEKKVRILERDGQKAPPQKIAQALEATSKSQNLVDVFNKTAKREIELANKRIVDPDEPYLTHQPISNLKELDQLTDPIFNYAKANVLKHIGEKNGFKVKIEGSNVSPSVYAKFTKVDDEGVTDFKVRISDHADVSRNKPAGEKKAYDINPDSNGSMEEIIQLLNDQNWLKQFYELD